MTIKLPALIEDFEDIPSQGVSSSPMSFHPQDTAFESVRAAEIFNGKRPSNFAISWISGKEDVLFFLPKPMFAVLLPFFVLEVLREVRERGSIVNTSELAGILTDLDLFDHPCVLNVITSNSEAFKKFFEWLLCNGFADESDVSRLSTLL